MSTPYNSAFACLECCKSFKREFNLAEGRPETMVCPDCKGVAYNFGRHFKAPKKSDKKQWDKVRFLFKHGFRFQKIRTVPNSTESIPYPKTMHEAREFVEKYKKHAIT